MKERPILFSGPMVRAILEGRKTQTRRVFKLPKDLQWYDALGGEKEGWFTDGKGWWNIEEMACPYGTVGDRLWVRESCSSDGAVIHYPADNSFVEVPDSRYDDAIKLHHYRGGFTKTVPSIHMPRWASRLTLEITGVRVERLQEISRSDVRSEGVPDTAGDWDHCPMTGHEWDNKTYLEQWQWLWEKINGPESWAANPWVWVIEFRRVQS